MLSLIILSMTTSVFLFIFVGKNVSLQKKLCQLTCTFSYLLRNFYFQSFEIDMCLHILWNFLLFTCSHHIIAILHIYLYTVFPVSARAFINFFQIYGALVKGGRALILNIFKPAGGGGGGGCAHWHTKKKL